MSSLNRVGVGANIMCVEEICNNLALLEDNIRPMKVSTPDYKGMYPADAVKAFHDRRAQYRKIYQMLED